VPNASLRICAVAAAVGLAGMSHGVRAQGARASSERDGARDEAVARVSAYVESYYARAQRVMAEERVTIQPLRPDLTPDGFSRRLIYDVRIEWDPAADGGRGQATAVRELVRVGNRAPRSGDEPGCTDPRPVSPEPLAFLLPTQRQKFTFELAGQKRVNRRAAVTLDYKSTFVEPPKVTWTDECVSIDLPGRTRGRVWADAETDAVVRLDERIVGNVDIPVPRQQQRPGASMALVVERAETSIEYQQVTFADPEETLMLPSRIDTLTVVRNSGSPRVRTTQVFSRYRRFLTASRVIE
jgi:hypothetical protein